MGSTSCHRCCRHSWTCLAGRSSRCCSAGDYFAPSTPEQPCASITACPGRQACSTILIGGSSCKNLSPEFEHSIALRAQVDVIGFLRVTAVASATDDRKTEAKLGIGLLRRPSQVFAATQQRGSFFF